MLQGPILSRVAPASASVFLAFVVISMVAVACSADPIVREGELTAATATPEPFPTDTASVDAQASSAENSSSGPDEGGTDPDVPDVPAELDGFQIFDPVQVASLLADCQGGSDMACDVLFVAAKFGSDEEAIARTCAGRSERDVVFCTDGLEPAGDELWFDVDSAALDRIAAGCQGGDMTACDLLYFRSPVGSTYESVGRGCGGRVTVVFPDCRTAFGGVAND